jgi:hypothetical protein
MPLLAVYRSDCHKGDHYEQLSGKTRLAVMEVSKPSVRKFRAKASFPE